MLGSLHARLAGVEDIRAMLVEISAHEPVYAQIEASCQHERVEIYLGVRILLEMRLRLVVSDPYLVVIDLQHIDMP